MKGIVLREKDAAIENRARNAGLGVLISDVLEIRFDKTLFVEPGTRVPFGLLTAAWFFLDRWDAAVPLWRYGVTAANVGTAQERKATEAIMRDLRVLLHSYELLFVRNNAAGRALVETWAKESAGGGEKRLAFLRAVYLVKPKLCVLPISWLTDVHEHSKQSLMRGHRNGSGRPANSSRPLVRIELEPGRFVKCHQGDEERVREHFARQKPGRH